MRGGATHAFIVAGLVISILAVVFAVQNPEVVGVSFLFWRFEGSLALVLLITFALGFVTSTLAAAVSMIRKRRVIAENERRIIELEAEAVGESAAPVGTPGGKPGDAVPPDSGVPVSKEKPASPWRNEPFR